VPAESSSPIAYFCAEFGIQSDLPMYAGGLGVLAGDVLKQAVDDHVPMIGVGLLYRGKYAHQVIDLDGSQTEAHDDFDPLSHGLEHVYLDDQPVFIRVHLTQLDIWLRCWQKKLGPDVTLYLLDPDTDQNHLTERSICHALYCGTQEAQTTVFTRNWRRQITKKIKHHSPRLSLE
jgi:starch phosphorylase